MNRQFDICNVTLQEKLANFLCQLTLIIPFIIGMLPLCFFYWCFASDARERDIQKEIPKEMFRTGFMCLTFRSYTRRTYKDILEMREIKNDT